MLTVGLTNVRPISTSLTRGSVISNCHVVYQAWGGLSPAFGAASGGRYLRGFVYFDQSRRYVNGESDVFQLQLQ